MTEENPEDITKNIPENIPHHIQDHIEEDSNVAATENLDQAKDSFSLSLSSFSGPIDLLLHLVKKNELEINALALAEVCEQYLSFVQREAQSIDLDLASEYLIIAATLVSIKSNLVLDQPSDLLEEVDGEIIDLQEELLQRLRKAEVYKKASGFIATRPVLNDTVYGPVSALNEYEALDAGFADHDSYLLVKAFNKVLARLKEAEPEYKIVLDSVSIVDRMSFVVKSLELKGRLSLFKLLTQDSISLSENKANVIGTFLALLELAKRQVLNIKLEKEEAMISLVDGDYQPENSEFDSESNLGVAEN